MKNSVKYNITVEFKDTFDGSKDRIIKKYTYTGNYASNEKIAKRIASKMANVRNIWVKISSRCNSSGKSFEDTSICLEGF